MLEIITVPVTAIEQNCRILFDSDEKGAVIVDPGSDYQKILEVLSQHKLSFSQIWLTHSHYDHCGGVQDLLDQQTVPLYAHAAGKDFREIVELAAGRFGEASVNYRNCPEPDYFLEEGQKLQVGKYDFDVFYTPGHAPDHVVFYNQLEKVLIAGDTVFKGSIGRTDLPGGSYEVLMESIKDKIMTLPDDTKILSGHGEDSVLSFEKSSNPFLIEMNGQ